MRCIESPGSRYFLRPLLLLMVTAGLSLFVLTPAHSEWRIEPTIAVGLEYDTNARLSPESDLEEEVDAYAVAAEARFIHRSQIAEFWIEPRIQSKRYNGSEFASTFDADDQFVDFLYDRRGQRYRFRFRGDFANENVRTAERSDVDFDIEEPDEIPDDDSGRVFGTTDRQKLRLVPDWSYRVGRRTSIGLRVTYDDISYDDDPLNFLNDFTTTTFTGSIGYNWSERDTISLVGYQRDTDFEAGAREASGHGVAIRYGRSISDKTRLGIDVGVDTTEDENGEDQSNPVGGFSFVRQFETGRLLASYRRGVSGSGAGSELVRDTINIDATRDLSERVSFGLGFRAYQTNALESNAVDVDERDYLQFRALLGWRLTKVFSVQFDYRYTYFDRQQLEILQLDSSADSHRINIWFSYSPVL